MSKAGWCSAPNTRLLDQTIEIREGAGEAVFQLDRIPLLDGTYTVTLGITSYDEGVVYDWREEACNSR